MRCVFLFLLAITSLPAADSKPVNNPLRSPAGLTRGGPVPQAANWKGRDAIRIADDGRGGRNSELTTFSGLTFRNGTIEVDIAAQPGAAAVEGARGFAGVAFRVKEKGNYEAFYLRPTNGRADDQLRRNHSAQYISEPEFPWERLRKDTPGLYESYVDLEPGVWTHVKIVVSGLRAELFVGNATQPCLIVKDLKKGETEGGVALWIGPGTEAYFANFKMTPAP